MTAKPSSLRVQMQLNNLHILTFVSFSLKGTGSRHPYCSNSLESAVSFLSAFLSETRTFIGWVTIESHWKDAASTRCFNICPLGFRCCFYVKSMPEYVIAMSLQSDSLATWSSVWKLPQWGCLGNEMTLHLEKRRLWVF